MKTDLKICRRALEMVGAKQIRSLKDKTIEAQLCNQIYKDARDQLLTGFRWSFAPPKTGDEFPDYFEHALVARVSARLATCLEQPSTKQAALHEKARLEFERAKFYDGQDFMTRQGGAQ